MYCKTHPYVHSYKSIVTYKRLPFNVYELYILHCQRKYVKAHIANNQFRGKCDKN